MEKLTETVTGVLKTAPEWVRNGLSSEELPTRLKAEEELAVLITAAVKGTNEHEAGEQASSKKRLGVRF